jgi:hypothetical protein
MTAGPVTTADELGEVRGDALAVERLDDEPLADAVPDLKKAAFDTLDAVIAAIDAAYDAADALNTASCAQRPDLEDPIDPEGRVRTESGG